MTRERRVARPGRAGGRRGARQIVGGLVALAAVAGALPAGGDPQEPIPVVTLDALPLGLAVEHLDPAARDLVEGVLGRTVFAHRVSPIRLRSREAVFRFLLDHPDFAAAVARALGVGEYRLVAVGDGYWGDDARGATGWIRVLYADEARRLYHVEGQYERGPWPAIRGQLLVLLEFEHVEEPDGNTVLVAALTGHVRLDSPLASPVAQALATVGRPFLERAAERKVRRFFRTVARVSRWAAEEPEALATLLERHPEVPPGPILDAFRALLLDGRPPLWARERYRLLPAPEGPGRGTAPVPADAADP